MNKDLEGKLPLSPVYYQIALDRELKEVKNCLFLENPPEQCEKDFMKKLNEVYFLYKETSDEEYKEVFNNSAKKYAGVINRKFPNRLKKKIDLLKETGLSERELLYGMNDSDTVYHNNLENFEN